MIFKASSKIQDTEERAIIVECSCGTHLIKISKFKDDSTYFVNFYTDDFYSKQHENIFKRLYTKIKRILNILLNKEYRVSELCLNRTDVDKIIDSLSLLKEEK